MKIGVFVGSFNPPHEGHIKVVNYLIDNHIVDKVLMLPTPSYWHKQNLVDVKHRVNMLKFYENNKIIVDNIHNKYPYTYLVLDSLKKDYINDELYLILGSDNVLTLDKWKNINYLLKYKIIVINRGDNLDKLNNYIKKFDSNNFIVIDNFSYLDISSTEIRKGCTKYLNSQILKYIRKNNLYK